jgi:hypothetical protein
MAEFDKPGEFYLGKHYDLAQRKRADQPLLYDAKDLTTHAVCVGMTGSGKTGLCLALLEEAALDGISVIAIDPKGDVGNLLLAFPELRPSDFRPWIEEGEAAREKITPDELAEKTAKQWREGLADWGQDGDRIRKYRDAVETAIYTPGSSAGLPLSVLRSFDAPSREIIDDADLLGDRIGAAVSGLLTLVGVDADPIKSREHILISQLLGNAWRKGENLDLATLVRQIQKPPLDRVGSIDLETFYPAKARTELSMQLNNLLASPSFASWMEGEPLNIANLLHNKDGKPRLSVLSIAHLSEAERMFFVTILLNELVSWVRTQSGTSSLRAILYMDEVFGYFPPTANPPSKKPMLTLLKQARAYGLGVVLATQNPVDLDYKGLSNAGTWFLGRLQTERDKARVLEGLEGASAAAGSSFNRGEMEATLAGLGKRVFLLNSVHEDKPVVFESRWCMSYLRGPLTRGQIQSLMADRKSKDKSPASASSPTAPAQPAGTISSASADRPLVAAEIEQVFLQLGNPVDTVYRPALLGTARVHFIDTKADIDTWQDVTAVVKIDGQVPDHLWDHADVSEGTGPPASAEPAAGVGFATLPGEMSRAKSYATWGKDLAGHLYREHVLSLWTAPALKQFSRPGESDTEFKLRLATALLEEKNAAIAAAKQDHEKQLAKLDQKITQAESRIGRQKSQFWSRIFEAFLSMVSMVAQISSSRKWASSRNVSTTKTTARNAGRIAQDRESMSQWTQQIEDLREQKSNCEEELTEQLAAIEAKYTQPAIEKYPIPPRKSDISVSSVKLAWIR